MYVPEHLLKIYSQITRSLIIGRRFSQMCTLLAVELGIWYWNGWKYTSAVERPRRDYKKVAVHKLALSTANSPSGFEDSMSNDFFI